MEQREEAELGIGIWASGARRSGNVPRYRAALFAVSIALAVVQLAMASTPAADADSPGPTVVRRITAAQYRQIVADIFGTDIKFEGWFAPEMRESGLLAIGSGHVSVTTPDLEQFDVMARTIAAQAVDAAHRDSLIPCKPASATALDDACAGRFLAAAGRLLYRRPLTEGELQAEVAGASAATKAVNDFYTGLGFSLSGLLESPEFLFRRETAEADPDRPGQFRLNAFSEASQLSFFLWNAGPDGALLAAAESGELNSDKGLLRQVHRMLASPRFEAGVRAFFADMLGFDEFETLAKDSKIYPKFTEQAAKDAPEQTMRTLVDLLVTQRGDYRDVFTTRKTFLTPSLGGIYGVMVPKSARNTAEWLPMEYPEGDPRAGILAQVSFSALHSHPGQSAPTLRGRALREILMCQKIPDPPGNVNFSVAQDTSNPLYKTARERLTAHRTDAVCAGCHALIDPVGLAMENFDGAGGVRMTENGAKIDASGEIDGIPFKDIQGLDRAMHDSPAATACLVERAATYALGRVTVKGEADWVKSLKKGFAQGGYKVPDLFREIATSPEFFRVSPPSIGALDMPAPPTASPSNIQQGSVP